MSKKKLTALFFLIFLSSFCNSYEVFIERAKRRPSQRVNRGVDTSKVSSSSSSSVINNTSTSEEISTSASVNKDSYGSGACECMEYWTCAAKNGQPYSYCGISDTEVCCFLNDPVEDIVPTTASSILEIETISTTTILPFKTIGEVIFSNKSSVAVTVVENETTDSSIKEDETGDHIPIQLTESGFRPIAIINESAHLIRNNKSSCGKQKIDVELDSVAQFREWPWHVAILEVAEDLYICGGALISPNRVITAAHCIQGYKNERSNRLKIRAGEYDVSHNDEADAHVEVLVNMIAIHPLFNNGSLANDIAILGLTRKIQFENNIQPVCLPPWGRIPTGDCVVTGWGRRTEDSEHSIVLKEILVPLWQQDQCERRLQKSFGPNYKLSPAAICAGDKGRDACDGDGGSPMVCRNREDGRWVHEGIVSFGVGCGRANSPGVYTRVSAFTNWIQNFL